MNGVSQVRLHILSIWMKFCKIADPTPNECTEFQNNQQFSEIWFLKYHQYGFLRFLGLWDNHFCEITFRDTFEVVCAFHKDATWSFTREVFQACPVWRPVIVLEQLYSYTGLRTPQSELANVPRKREVWGPLLKLVPLKWVRWIDGWMTQYFPTGWLIPSD